jgi:carbon monoxide dehydrogenase subunit G
MSDLSTYESRTGKLTCKPEEVFDFVTDIRNFSQFVPDGSISELEIGRESCSFNVPPLGNIKMDLSEKEPYNKVVYSGTAFTSNKFSLILSIKEDFAGKAEVIVKLAASLNPLLKMIAAQYIDRFLGTLVDEMEKFRGWKNITK